VRIYGAGALSLLFILLAVALVACAGSPDSAAVPPGQDEVIAEILGRGKIFPGECRFAGGDAGRSIRATYVCRDGEIVVELLHPGGARASAVNTARFAVVLRGKPIPDGFADALAANIRSHEGAFQWKIFRSREARRAAALVLSLIGPLVACVALARTLYGRLPRPAEARRPPRPTLPVAAAGIRAAGLIAVASVAWRAAATQAGAPENGLPLLFAMLCLAMFLWLLLSGFFGYGSARRSDWVAILPFSVALAVREIFTLHSIQEIEIHFARGPVVKHSVVYPVLQLFFAPLVRDLHSFTMHMNGVLGALAALSMYLFVRQRLRSRAAGFLCALFLATHPLVARFSPTDGPYAMLLFTWFSGLALLSAPHLTPRAIFGGIALLGIAATTRGEGAVLLPASVLLLDVRVLADVLRRHSVVTALSFIVVVVLVAVQMYAILLLHLGNVPEIPDRGSLMWPILHHGPAFTSLVAIGVLSGIVTRQRFGLLAFLAMLIVAAPVARSVFTVGLHRLVPACALQSMIAGIGAYSLTAWPPPGIWRRLAVIPGVAVAFLVLSRHWSELTRPYVFTEQYDLVRRHLAPGGASAPGCTLMAFPPPRDVDLHDFGQVVPEMRVLDCTVTDCAGELRDGGCFYYVRSAAGYFHEAGIPPGCARTGMMGPDDLPCLNEASASFERSVELDPVEVRTVDISGTFGEAEGSYPQQAEIGLFRVRARSF
jgi:hypothetical protein